MRILYSVEYIGNCRAGDTSLARDINAGEEFLAQSRLLFLSHKPFYPQ
jgi:hypothetical protein